MDVSVRHAASVQTHAVEYHRREQLAMLAWRNGGHSLTAEDLFTFVRSPSRVPPAVAALLVLFPWAAFVLRFVESTKSLGDDDVKQMRVGASLCDVLPWNVCHGKRLRLYDLLERLVARVTPPLNNQALSIEPLMSTLRDCSCLLMVDAAFIGCVVREYDAVACELRWLALPTVLQRKLHFEVYLETHPWLVLCKASLPSALAALVSLCAPRSLSAALLENNLLLHSHVQDVRLRLLVQLFECASHYVAVGGCEFVRQAAATLLEGRAEIECVLPLFADLLRGAIVVAGRGAAPFIVRPTLEMYGLRQPETTVLFEKEPATWHVGRLSGNPPQFERRTLPNASTPLSLALFQKLRLAGTDGQTSLNQLNSVTTDNLLMLVGGESDRFLNGDAIRDLLHLATRGFNQIVCFEPLAIDTSTERGKEILTAAAESTKAKCAQRDATRLFVPWNNRSFHWTLLCLDLTAQTAIYLDSLSSVGSRSRRQPSELHLFCKQFFGEHWTGMIDSLPSPQQPDAHNCGVYMVLNAWHLARDQPLPREYPPGAQLRVSLAKCWLNDQALTW
jgi:hypothetical protein